MGPKKKQLSILLFAFERTEPAAVTVVDDADPHPVACPVCAASIAQLSIEKRILHVEECLLMLAIKEDPGLRSQQSDSAALTRQQVKNEPAATKTEQTAVTVKDDKNKRRKVESAVHREIAKYVNVKKEPKKRATRVPSQADDDALELLPSTRKNEIPELKTLSFPTRGKDVYQVSVDAFCYKPHDTIKQYFLSHFHSDHYGGITKRWCRERTLESKIIYCSPITSRLLTIKFKVDPAFIFEMETNLRYKVHSYEECIDNGGHLEPREERPGLYVTLMEANHCPGAVIFLFESISHEMDRTYYLHCGDFRVNKAMIDHPLLRPFHSDRSKQLLDKVYLDTTYMSPKYNFPKQEHVCDSAAELFHRLVNEEKLFNTWFGSSLQSRITDFLTFGKKEKKKKFLILVGTYLIGKEKLAIAILKKFNKCPIYVSNINSRGEKREILNAYEDEYLREVLTDSEIGNHEDVMVHLVPMKIVGTILELSNYFNHNSYFHHFERCVGLRPTGWSFKGNDDELEMARKLEMPPTEDELPIVEAEHVTIDSTLTVLKNSSEYSYMDILRQHLPAKSDRNKFDASTFRIYSLPYSEHLSYRELSFFVVLLNIGEVIPTVNTGNQWSVTRMREIIRNWEVLRLSRTSTQSPLPRGLHERVRTVSLDDF